MEHYLYLFPNFTFHISEFHDQDTGCSDSDLCCAQPKLISSEDEIRSANGAFWSWSQWNAWSVQCRPSNTCRRPTVLMLS
jgi:hypothetical protein